MNEVKNLPELRFSEFTDAISQIALEKIITFQSGYAFKSSEMKSDNGNFQLIKMSNVYKNQLALDRNPSYWDCIENNQKPFILKTGDVVLTLTGTVGKRDFGYSVFVEVDDKYLLNQRLVRLRAVEQKSVGQFIKNLVKTEKFLDYFFKSSKGGTGNQANVGIDDVKKYRAAIPKIEEQQKIAVFLSSVDKKIEQLTEKHRLLTEYKKGVMQQIFTQQIRFKDNQGNDYPDWNNSKFGDVFTRVTRKNKENNLNVMTISAQQGLINQEKYFNKSVSASNVTGYYLLKKGEFAYNKSYSAGYPMGAIKRLNRYDEGCLSTLYICFEAKEKGLPEFFEQYFEAGMLNQEIKKIAQEGARNHGLLNISVVEFFRDIKIDFPCMEEQQKIANFLTEIDQKIDQAWSTLEQTKAFKKGLLQKMFV